MNNVLSIVLRVMLSVILSTMVVVWVVTGDTVLLMVIIGYIASLWICMRWLRREM